MPKQNDFMSRLAELVGQTVAGQLAADWGGQLVYIKLDRSHRDAEIFAAFTGDNHDELAERFKCSVQHIYRVVKIARARANSASPHLSISELQEISALTVTLVELRQNECKNLCIENIAPELFNKLLTALIAVKRNA